MTDLTIQAIYGEEETADAPVPRDLEKLIVGGLGGVMPIVATLMVGEYEKFPLTLEADSVQFYIGFALRAALFFTVGAVFVWLHHDVRTRYAVFRLGVAARPRS